MSENKEIVELKSSIISLEKTFTKLTKDLTNVFVKEISDLHIKLNDLEVKLDNVTKSNPEEEIKKEKFITKGQYFKDNYLDFKGELYDEETFNEILNSNEVKGEKTEDKKNKKLISILYKHITSKNSTSALKYKKIYDDAKKKFENNEE